MKYVNDPDPLLDFKNPGQWRNWLASNHGSESGAWLMIKKYGSQDEGITLAEAVTEALCFGWIDSRMKSLGDEGYMLRFTPRKPKSIWSKINRQRAEALVENGRMTESGLAAIREAKENGQWQSAYSSKEKPDVPPDLLEELKSHAGALDNFSKWANSQQLQAVFWIDQAKRPQTRQKRIKYVVAKAKSDEKFI
ncbi:MAG: YdeI family protein [Clostridiaceae bacterium]